MPAEGVDRDRYAPSSQGLPLGRLRTMAAATGNGVKPPGPQRIEASSRERRLKVTGGVVLLQRDHTSAQ